MAEEAERPVDPERAEDREPDHRAVVANDVCVVRDGLLELAPKPRPAGSPVIRDREGFLAATSPPPVRVAHRPGADWLRIINRAMSAKEDGDSDEVVFKRAAADTGREESGLRQQFADQRQASNRRLDEVFQDASRDSRGEK